MPKSLLVTCPKYDDGTEYLSAYTSLVVNEAKENHILVKEFLQKEVNKENIEKYLKIKNPPIVFLNGHGNAREIYGHKKIIFSLNNASLLQNKIVYARACCAGRKLGKEIVKDNIGCFIGYTSPFSFWISGDWSAKPLNDKIASLYLKPSNAIISRIIKGKSAKDADKYSKQLMIKNMKKLLSWEDKKEPGATQMLQILWTNYE